MRHRAVCCLLTLLALWSVALAQTHTTISKEQMGMVSPIVARTTPCTDAAISTALAAPPTGQIGSAAKMLLLDAVDGAGAACTWTIATSLTIPRNVTLRIPRGTTVVVNAGQTLRVAGPILADDPDWYSGAGTVTFTYKPQGSEERYGAMFPPFIVSGCVHGTSATTTSPSFACEVITPDGRHSYQATTTVTYAAGDGTYWLANHKDTSTVVSGWTREGATHLLWQRTANQPANPAGGLVVQKVTVATSAITASAPVASAGRSPVSTNQRVINVSEFATGGIGTSASPWTGWDTAIGTWRPQTTYLFVPGTYSYSTTLIWNSVGLRILGMGWRQTILQHTGSGNAIEMDGGLTGSGVNNIQVEDLTIQGNAATTSAIFQRSIFRSLFRNLRLRDFTGSGIAAQFSVLNLYENISVSVNEGNFTVIPTHGLVFDWRTADNFHSSANTIINPIIEGVSGNGIWLAHALNHTIIGGTSEHNAVGLVLAAPAEGNTIIQTDFEQNITDDVSVVGNNNTLVSVFGGTTTRFQTGSKGNTLQGGKYTDIILDDGVLSLTLEGVHASHNLIDNTNGVANIRKHGFYVANTDLYESDVTRDFTLAAAHQTAMRLNSLSELLTIEATPFTQALSTLLPTNSIIFAVSVRVVTPIPTATTFSVRGWPSDTVFASGVSTAGNTTNPGIMNCPYPSVSAENIRITPDVTPLTNSGQVRLVILYGLITPPQQ